MIFALFAGSALRGMLGAIIAVHLAGALRILFVRFAALAIRRRTGAPEAHDG